MSEPAPQVVVNGLHYPEGAFWSALDDCLYFVEWQADRVWRLRGDRAAHIFQTPPGSGPCGLTQAPDGTFWLCLYTAGQVIHTTRTGTLLHRYANFRGPNDLIMDSHANLIFTASGDFAEDWHTGRAAGSLHLITPAGAVKQLAADLHYLNGLALIANETRLVVAEHRRNRLLCFDLQPDATLTNQHIFTALPTGHRLPPDLACELGPDGLCAAPDDSLWVAHYGAGRVLHISPDGHLLGHITLPHDSKPTNVALTPGAQTLYITAAAQGLLYRVPPT